MDYQNDYDMYEQRTRAMTRGEAKKTLVTRVYTKLTLSILALAALEATLFGIFGMERIMTFTAANTQVMGGVLVALCLVGPFVGNMILRRNPSRATQYGLLAFYILLETALLFPLLAVVGCYCGGPAVIWQACGLTASLFIALSAAVFATRVDFSFLRSFLLFTGLAAIVLVVAALVFNFYLGTWFSIAMIFFACGYILYDTSNMVRNADPDDDILCTISLFTSVMTLFYYILRILGQLNRG